MGTLYCFIIPSFHPALSNPIKVAERLHFRADTCRRHVPTCAAWVRVRGMGASARYGARVRNLFAFG